MFDLLNSMMYDLKRSVYLRWLFDPVLYSSLRWSCFDVAMLFFDLLSTFWISILLICLIFFRQHSLNKTYVVLVAKQMLKHLRIAKKIALYKCPGKFKCRYVFVVSLSVRFLFIVITRLCWYPKLPLFYYFLFFRS